MQPHTVHSERLTGVLRDRLACRTRTTHAFAMQPTLWDAAVGLALFAHTWLRPQPALRLPPPQPAPHAGHDPWGDRPFLHLGQVPHPALSHDVRE